MRLPRVRFRIGLRGMMILVLFVGVALGWKARRASIQRHSVATIERLGGSVGYDWQYCYGTELPTGPARGPDAPAWLRRLVGDEYLQEVVLVNIEDNKPGWRVFGADQLACLDGLDHLESLRLEVRGVDPSGLATIARLSRLKFLDLNSRLDARLLAPLGRLTELESIDLWLTPTSTDDMAFLDDLLKLRQIKINEVEIDDDGLARIARHDRLEEIEINAPQLTDAGLANLEKLSELRRLYLGWTPMTKARLMHIGKLSKLIELSFSRKLLDDREIEEFMAAKPDISVHLFQ